MTEVNNISYEKVRAIILSYPIHSIHYEQSEYLGDRITRALPVRFVVLSAVLGIRSALVRNAGGHSSILYVSRARFGLFYRRTPCESGSL